MGRSALVVRCRRCCLVYTRPLLVPEGNPYEEYSGEEYFQGKDPASRIQNGARLAAVTERFVGRKGRLLELGCGRGELLEGARRQGWEVAGVDMTPAFATTRPDLRVEVSPVAAASLLEENYEAIWLAAILEHLYDPGETLARVYRALVPNGIVFIDVPNECSLWTRVGNAYMRLRGRDWAINLSPTFPPFHVVGFCPRSLRRLLERTDFETLDLRTHRWRNELPVRPGVVAQMERLGTEAILSWGAIVGMGAGITCWARRRA
jgi:SAM-dependent methyltransferase